MKLPKLIGVIHLAPLPGSPAAHGHHPADALQHAGAQAVEEAYQLSKSGFDAIILENFGDAPFFKSSVPRETIASMSIIAAALRETVGSMQIGINVLRNDGMSALAIAAVTGCDFIRVNVLSGVAATDQGMVEGEAALLLRERDRLHANVAILADVHVKHAMTLSSHDLSVAIEDVGTRAKADGVIITGQTTGRLADLGTLQVASKVARSLKLPLYLGSGATAEKLSEIKPWVDGIIVGSTLRKGGIAGAPLDNKRVIEFAKMFRQIQVKKKSSVSRKEKSRKK